MSNPLFNSSSLSAIGNCNPELDGRRSMAVSITLRNPNKYSSISLQCCFSYYLPIRSSPHGCNGETYSAAAIQSLGRRRVENHSVENPPLPKDGCGEEQVRILRGSSLSLSRLLHVSPNRNRHYNFQQVPFVLSYAGSLSFVQEKLPMSFISNGTSCGIDLALLRPSLGFRGFCSGTDDTVESDGETRADDHGVKSSSTDDGIDSDDETGSGDEDCAKSSSADPKEVERVCKVIDELFALDRNMEVVLDEVGVNLSHDLVVDVLDRFKHARKPSYRFFCWAREKPGFSHDSRTYNSMMNILAKTRQFETLVSMLEEMGAKGLLTKETFIIAIKAFAAAKERKKAVGIFELMKKYKFKVGVETINCLLDSLGRAKLGKEAQVLFDRLKERFTPNLKTYSVLLNGWCRLRNLLEAGRIWNEMIDRGFKPDIVAHNIMLEGLLRSKKNSDAAKLFHVMKAKGPSPNVRSYTIMIRDFCKQTRMRDAVEYFDEMLDSGLQPDSAVYTCLISGFGNIRRLDTVYELLKEMQEKGCPPDGKTYNSLIKIMTSQKWPSDATRIYNKMIQNGIEPSIHTYNMIMKSYFLTRDYEMGREVWNEMIKKGIYPDDNSYTVFIRGLISQGKSREACRYLEEMLEKGMKAPQIDYNKFGADFYRAGKPQIFEELAQRMKFTGKFEASNMFARWGEMTRRKFRPRFDTKVDGRCS